MTRWRACRSVVRVARLGAPVAYDGKRSDSYSQQHRDCESRHPTHVSILS
jgi:hypothetical protein